ncbi:MAG TPA: energy transducer TonB [Rhodospirillaceae bacterium]|nr:energy transducer TonB [Rhodospirillaceae bacterium]
MMRGATLLWAALAAAIGTGLFVLKYEVQEEEQKLRVLRKDIAQAQEAIHVAKAEWSYLNDPLRLKDQAEHHLGLHSLKPGQVAVIDQLPMAQPVSAAAEQPQSAPRPGSTPASTPAPPKAAQMPAKAPAPPAAGTPAKSPAKTPAPITTAAVQPNFRPPARPVAELALPKPVVALPPDNVMVITSPAVLEPEMASVRRHP